MALLYLKFWYSRNLIITPLMNQRILTKPACEIRLLNRTVPPAANAVLARGTVRRKHKKQP